MISMKAYGRSRKTFFNIFIAITINVVFVTIVLTVALYNIFENMSLTYLNNANVRLLSQTNNTLKYIDTSVKTISMSILMNNDVRFLLYNNGDDIFSVYNALNRVENTVSSIPYIDSVYLYNSSQDLYYTTTTNRSSTKKDFFDTEINQLIDKPGVMQYTLLPRKIPSYDLKGEFQIVYTYIFFDRSITGSAKNDAIIVNIKTDWFNEQIKSLNTLSSYYSDKKNFNLIIDNNGKIVNHPDKQFFLKDISSEAYIKKILSSNKNSGYFLGAVNNEKSIISFYSPIHDLGWTYINITPYSAVIAQMKVIKSVAILLCLLMIFIGFIISFLLSKKVYNPIDMLVKNVKRFFQGTETLSQTLDEMKFISESFDRTVKKVNALESFRINNYQFLRQEAIKDILLNDMTNLEELTKQFDGLDSLFSSGQQLCLIIFKIDHFRQYLEKNNSTDQSLMRFAICNISSEILFNQYPCETIDMGYDHIVVILRLPVEISNLEQIECTLDSHIRQIQITYKDYYQISLSSTISSCTHDFSLLSTLYNDTLNISNFRLTYGHGSIIYTDSIKSMTFIEFKYPYDKQQILNEALKLGMLLQAEEILEEITTIICSFFYANIILSYTMLASSIFNTINIIECNRNISFGLDYYSFNKTISNLETIDEINLEFKVLLKTFAFTINSAKNNETASMIESISHMIRNNYMDINLSLEQIADHYKMSPNYLSKIFKEKTMYSIADYIINIRLENAKELLINSNKNINEISELIGFVNTKYLFKVFKKKFGVTPREFRLKNTINI